VQALPDGGPGAAAPGDGGDSGDGGARGAPRCPTTPTGYPGDDQCLEAPPRDEGIQIHFGPSRYDDPDEVARFVVPAGETRDWCFEQLVSLGEPVERFISSRIIHLRPGARAGQVLLANASSSLGGPHDCPFGLTPVVSTTALTAAGAVASDAPELAGAAITFSAGSIEARVQVVNDTSEPILAEGWFNLLFAPVPDGAQAPEQVLHPVRLAAWTEAALPDGGTSLVTGGDPDCVTDVPRQLVSLSWEEGAGVRRASVFRKRAGSVDREPIFEAYPGHGDVSLTYDSVTSNPTPDRGAGTSGGVSGAVVLAPGDELEWECEVIGSTERHNGECLLYGRYLEDAPVSVWDCTALAGGD
jgi:hypothetical protein